MILLYVKVFNAIFNCGKLPEAWLKGTILPIYKNKGSSSDPKNYRPITIVSCFGKLFTSILNERLQSFSAQYSLICENQAGFRKNYSTLDNIFQARIQDFGLEGAKIGEGSGDRPGSSYN